MSMSAAPRRCGSLSCEAGSCRTGKEWLKAACGVVRDRPSTLVIPLVLLAVLTAAGVTAVVMASNAAVSDSRSDAALDLQVAADSLRQGMERTLEPAESMGAFIAELQDFSVVNRSFDAVASQLVAQLARKLSKHSFMELAPNGHISNVAPLSSYSQQRLGLDTLNTPWGQELMSVIGARTVSLQGPLPLNLALPDGTTTLGDTAMVSWYPIFVPAATHNTSFNIPWNLTTDCPGSVCYDEASGTKFWGFVGMAVPFEEMLAADTLGLLKLRNQGYNYRLLQVSKHLNATPGYADPQTKGPATLLAGCGGDLVDPVTITLDLPGVMLCTPFTIMISKPTWTPAWRDPLLAFVVTASFVVSVLLFLLLLYMSERSRQPYALTPGKTVRPLISSRYDAVIEVSNRRAKEDKEAEGDTSMIQSGAPVERLMNILSAALMGQVPQLEDVLAVRQAIMLGGGAGSLFQPENLKEQLQMYSQLKDYEVDGLVRELQGLDLHLPACTDPAVQLLDSGTAGTVPPTCMEPLDAAMSALLGAALAGGVQPKLPDQSSSPRSVPFQGCQLVSDASIPSTQSSKDVVSGCVYDDRPALRQSRLGSATSMSPPKSWQAVPGVQLGAHLKVRSAMELTALAPASAPPAVMKPPTCQVLAMLEAGFGKFDFNIFALAELTQDHALSALLYFLVQRTGLAQGLSLDPVKLARLALALEAGYKCNPYHNKTHAADVLQTLHTLLVRSHMVVAEGETGYCDPITLFACLLAAASHDLDHVGTTNDFLVATEDDLAVLYSDKSPMEHHHLACLFKLLKRQELDVLSGMPRQMKLRFRKIVIELVSATDMKQHFSIMSQFSTLHRLAATDHPWEAGPSNDDPSCRGGLSLYDVSIRGRPSPPLHGRSGRTASGAPSPFSRMSCEPQLHRGLTVPESPVATREHHPAPPTPADEAQLLVSLQVAMKCADIGSLAKSDQVCTRWATLLQEEFFLQGDKEQALGLPISPLFDRSKPGVMAAQAGFYDVVGLPLFHNFKCAFPGTRPFFKAAQQNYWRWKAKQLP